MEPLFRFDSGPATTFSTLPFLQLYHNLIFLGREVAYRRIFKPAYIPATATWIKFPEKLGKL